MFVEIKAVGVSTNQHSPASTQLRPQGYPILQVIWRKCAEIFNNPGYSSGIEMGLKLFHELAVMLL